MKNENRISPAVAHGPTPPVAGRRPVPAVALGRGLGALAIAVAAAFAGGCTSEPAHADGPANAAAGTGAGAHADEHGHTDSVEHGADPALANVLARLRFEPAAPGSDYARMMLPAEVVVPDHGRLHWGPPLEGRLLSLSALPGQRIAAGDVLGTLLSPARDGLRAEARRQRQSVEVLQQEVDQIATQVDRGMRSVSELQQARTALGLAEASLDAVQAQLASAQRLTGGDAAGEGAAIAWLAPADATLVSVHCGIGASLNAGQDCIEALLLDLAVVRVFVPAAEAATLGPESTLRWLPEGAADPTSLRWNRCAVEIDPQRRARACDFAPESDLALVPGQIGVGTLQRAAGEAWLSVPRRALTELEGVPSVFIQHTPDEAPEAVAVTVHAIDASQALIESPELQPGTSVLVDGVFLMRSWLLLGDAEGEEHAH
jgi:hypothetical protein